MQLEEMEKRFCEVTKLHINLSRFSISEEDYENQKQETIKELSKKYGYVPTPIYLVDRMIGFSNQKYPITEDTITCDYCAGCGQYTIRLLRFLANKINAETFLMNNHYLTELQPNNCAALVYIFGPNINLYVGDSINLKYSKEDDKGILFFNEKTKKWEHNKLVDSFLLKSIILNNLTALKAVFNTYDKTEEEIKQAMRFLFQQDCAEKLQEEEKQVEVITVEKVPEVIKQIKEQDKPKEEVKVVKETKPKKTTTKKKGIGNNTKEEADDFFNMFGGLQPLKT